MWLKISGKMAGKVGVIGEYFGHILWRLYGLPSTCSVLTPVWYLPGSRQTSAQYTTKSVPQSPDSSKNIFYPAP